MNDKRPSLGRGLGDLGLDVLLGNTRSDLATSQPNLIELPLTHIQPGPYQPRQYFDKHALNELAESIKSQGIIQPIIVTPAENGHYAIIAGERRWRAAKLAGLNEIPAIIRHSSKKSATAMALIENAQRSDLNPIEKAEALHKLSEDFDLTHQELASLIGQSRASISNHLRLRQLDDQVKTLLAQGTIDMGHARALITLTAEQQQDIAKKIVQRGLSVRATEQLIQQSNKPKTKKPTVHPQLAEQLTQALAAPCVLEENSKGKGKLIIHYSSPQQRERLAEQIKQGVTHNHQQKEHKD